jgi:2-amino-4-hydroxy-6-hydroxymethyldihydropteridine diphosphokinase
VPDPRSIPCARAARSDREAPPAAAGGVFLSLGSNLGDRRAHLEAGLRGLAERGVRPLACSPIYRTAPVGGPPQADYLNLVVEVGTALEPRALLEAALAVERSRGRERRPEERWGPRTLDIDIVLFRHRVVAEEGLSLPHPRLHRRRFVLVPLADLAPEAIHPVAGRTVGDLLRACPDRSACAREGPPPPLPGAPEALRREPGSATVVPPAAGP